MRLDKIHQDAISKLLTGNRHATQRRKFCRNCGRQRCRGNAGLLKAATLQSIGEGGDCQHSANSKPNSRRAGRSQSLMPRRSGCSSAPCQIPTTYADVGRSQTNPHLHRLDEPCPQTKCRQSANAKRCRWSCPSPLHR